MNVIVGKFIESNAGLGGTGPWKCYQDRVLIEQSIDRNSVHTGADSLNRRAKQWRQRESITVVHVIGDQARTPR